MEFIVKEAGRLDAAIAAGTSLSRSRARRAIDWELVTVNGEPAPRPAHKVKDGDRVEIDLELLPAEGAQIEPVDLHLPVLYEDDACIVIDKPSGIAVHPGAGMPKDEVTILHGVAYLFLERSIPFSTETALVHRLDKWTTGCLLIAKTATAHAALQKQFELRTVKKKYFALVSGVPNPPEAVIDANIGRSNANRTKMATMGIGKSREARTTYRTVASSKDASLLLCELHTGRTHQIRVHLSAIGHPVLGDETYGTRESHEASVHAHVSHICLHAWELTFESSKNGKMHSVHAPPPHSWKQIFKALSFPVGTLPGT